MNAPFIFVPACAAPPHISYLSSSSLFEAICSKDSHQDATPLEIATTATTLMPPLPSPPPTAPSSLVFSDRPIQSMISVPAGHNRIEFLPLIGIVHSFGMLLPSGCLALQDDHEQEELRHELATAAEEEKKSPKRRFVQSWAPLYANSGARYKASARSLAQWMLKCQEHMRPLLHNVDELKKRQISSMKFYRQDNGCLLLWDLWEQNFTPKGPLALDATDDVRRDHFAALASLGSTADLSKRNDTSDGKNNDNDGDDDDGDNCVFRSARAVELQSAIHHLAAPLPMDSDWVLFEGIRAAHFICTETDVREWDAQKRLVVGAQIVRNRVTSTSWHAGAALWFASSWGYLMVYSSYPVDGPCSNCALHPSSLVSLSLPTAPSSAVKSVSSRDDSPVGEHVDQKRANESKSETGKNTLSRGPIRGIPLELAYGKSRCGEMEVLLDGPICIHVDSVERGHSFEQRLPSRPSTYYFSLHGVTVVRCRVHRFLSPPLPASQASILSDASIPVNGTC